MGNKVSLFISHVWMSMVYVVKMFFMGYKIYGVIVIPIHAISYKKGGNTGFYVAFIVFR